LHGNRECSLILQKHEIVCLMGPSGCEKFTILRIISGHDTADSGVVNDEDKGQRYSSEHIPTAMVFQDHGLFPWLSVRENIAYLKVDEEGRLQTPPF